MGCAGFVIVVLAVVVDWLNEKNDLRSFDRDGKIRFFLCIRIGSAVRKVKSNRCFSFCEYGEVSPANSTIDADVDENKVTGDLATKK